MMAFVRALKGVYMGLMFLLFGVIILFGVLIVVPVLAVVSTIKGLDPGWMQAVNRFSFGLWLKGMELGGLLKLTTVKGKPADRPCVMVANHPGLFDVIELIHLVPRLSLLVKPSLVKKLPLKPIFRASGYVTAPGDAGLKDALHLVEDAVTLLKKGFHFLIFPEGTRSPKGGLGAFKPGAFKIAARAGVPVQPIVIRNNPPFLPHEDRWYFPPARLSLIEIEFLDPVPPPEPGRERSFAASMEALFKESLGLEAPLDRGDKIQQR